MYSSCFQLRTKEYLNKKAQYKKNSALLNVVSKLQVGKG